jgi:hypothetical protein
LRFYEITVGTKLVGARFIFGLTECSQHDDFNVFESFGISENIEHLKAANPRHHNVGNNKIRVLLFGDNQRLFPVLGAVDLVTFGLQASFVDLA